MAINNTGTLLAYAQTNTSSACFQYRWELRLDNTTQQSATYRIYTYLRWVSGSGGTPGLVKKDSCTVRNPDTGASEDCIGLGYTPNTFKAGITTLARMRHDWHITYVIDGKTETKYFRTEETWLPDDNAEVGTYNTGHLHMEKNVWYQWGPPKTGTWYNNGGKHTVQVTMHCEEFGYPWNCPSTDNVAAAKKTITMPQYAITPGIPIVSLTGTWYNHKVACTAVSNAKDYKLQVSVNGAAYTDVTSYGASREYTHANKFIYPPGTLLTYRAAVRSSTNNVKVSSNTVSIRVGGGVKIKVNGTWKPGIVYIKVNGVWKRADYIATKQNNAWKISEY